VIQTLLAPPDDDFLPSWQFDHAQAHRELLGGMSRTIELLGGRYQVGGLTEYSAIPYFIDPLLNTGMWHFDHGQAHKDASGALPGWFGFSATTSMLNPTLNLVDYDLQNEDHVTWWTFVNLMEHLTAQAVLPQQLIFPFQ
jgi:hypothetical protein